MPDPEFDAVIDRQGTYASKWREFEGRDVLPFPVADMEFKAPDFILNAVRERLAHGVLGYTETPEPVVDAFCTWVQHHYGWQIQPEWLVWLTGVVAGLNLSARAVRPATASGSILIPTPVYHPFLDVGDNTSQQPIEVPLILERAEARAPTSAPARAVERALHGDRWVMDFDALSAAVRPDTRLFLLCNPQNPTGRVYDRAELEAVAALSQAHDLVICSDEIHSGLTIAPGTKHIPIASLDPAIANRTISLFAATKTYNIPGLGCAIAVIPNADLRERFRAARAGLIHGTGPLAYAASQAAFEDRSDWLPRLQCYLHDNGVLLHDTLNALPRVSTTPVEGTYLAWIDVRALELADPYAYFESKGVALSDGVKFRGDGFLRFNFGCSRSLLSRGLQRFSDAVNQLN